MLMNIPLREVIYVENKQILYIFIQRNQVESNSTFCVVSLKIKILQGSRIYERAFNVFKTGTVWVDKWINLKQ